MVDIADYPHNKKMRVITNLYFNYTDNQLFYES